MTDDFFDPLRSCRFAKKESIPFSLAIGNGELMQECFPKHTHMGTARKQQDKETDEVRKRGVSMEKSIAGAKKNKSGWPSLPNQNTIIINLIW